LQPRACELDDIFTLSVRDRTSRLKAGALKMAAVWTQWEGQVVNGTYPLRRFLNASDHSAVFLTESGTEGFLNAAIKLVPAGPGSAEVQLWHWKTAATFTHPHLMRLLDSGQCEIQGQQLLFVVMEYAEETLAQVLPYRGLGSDEVRELLVPTLAALAFLHSESWVQGQLKPTNFLVVNDQLKLAVDTIRPVGVAREPVAHPTLYDPPEVERGEISTAADIWGLGVTLVEALTQYAPTWPRGRLEPPAFRAQLPAAFAEVIQRCLSVDPAERPTVDELGGRPRGGSAAQQVAGGTVAGAGAAAATGAAATTGTAAAPGSLTTGAGVAGTAAGSIAVGGRAGAGGAGAVGAGAGGASAGGASAGGASAGGASAGGASAGGASTRTAGASAMASASPAGSVTAGTTERPSPVMRASGSLSQSNSYAELTTELEPEKRNLLGHGIAAVVVVLLVAWGGWRLLHRPSATPPPSSLTGSSAASPTDSSPGSQAASTDTNTAAAPPHAGASEPAEASQRAGAPTPDGALPPAAKSPPAAAPRAAGAPPSASAPPRAHPALAAPPAPPPAAATTEQSRTRHEVDVVHEEIPKVSASSRQTIHGHVRVAVRVTVDRSGKVVRDSFENASSSSYFNRVATEAARKWKFAAADSEGSRQWLLHFEFGREATTVRATRPRS
jgi:TonB family protein